MSGSLFDDDDDDKPAWQKNVGPKGQAIDSIRRQVDALCKPQLKITAGNQTGPKEEEKVPAILDALIKVLNHYRDNAPVEREDVGLQLSAAQKALKSIDKQLTAVQAACDMLTDGQENRVVISFYQIKFRLINLQTELRTAWGSLMGKRIITSQSELDTMDDFQKAITQLCESLVAYNAMERTEATSTRRPPSQNPPQGRC